MSIQIADSFSLDRTIPLDKRLFFETINDMINYPETRLYSGIMSYNKETQKYYTYDVDNDYLIDLHKWRELSTNNASVDDLKFGFSISNFSSPLEGGTTYLAGETMTVALLKDNDDIQTIKFFANDIQVGVDQARVEGTLTYSQIITDNATENTTYKAVIVLNDGTEYSRSIVLKFAYPTYYGLITTPLLSATDLPSLNRIIQDKHDLIWRTAIYDNSRFVYSYPTSIGKLESIKDNNGLDYLVNSMTITNDTFNGIPYTTCVLTDSATVEDNDYILVFGGEEDNNYGQTETPEQTVINIGKSGGDTANHKSLIIQKNGTNVATYNSSIDVVANITTPTVTLNGTATNIPNFYAPTVAGTDGYVLTSRGANKAPVWKNLSQSNSSSIAHLKLNWNYTASVIQSINSSTQEYILASTNDSIVILGSDMESGNSPRWIEIKTAGTYYVTYSINVTSVYRNGFEFAIFKGGKDSTMDSFSQAVSNIANVMVKGHEGLQTMGNSPTIAESISETITDIFTIEATDFTDNNVSSFAIYPTVKVFNTQGFSGAGFIDIVKL